MSVRVRFAPSPTGNVHIGNIRAAIFNWLFARHEGGKFLLRIEDTDRERSTPEAVRTVIDALDWLGLNYDEEPMYQSRQHELHIRSAEDLVKKGMAYKEDKGGTGKGECIIFKMPGTDVEYDDVIKGHLKKEAKDLKDFVIVRSDGNTTFHLANVVDDIQMKTTHIIRGDDHVENTFKHICLFRALGAEPPKYGHLPMIVNHQGKPYSKRDGAAYVGDFRAKGFLAQALFNYLSLLGWSPGDNREKMTREEMIAAFTLDRVKSAAAQMDLQKLTHMNAAYIAEQPADVFIEAATKYLSGQTWFNGNIDDYFRKVCNLMQSRTHLYTYVLGWNYFFADEFPYDEKAVAKSLKKEGIKNALSQVLKETEGIDFAEPEIEKAIRRAEKTAGIPEGKLNGSIRVAVTGTTTGAGLYETMAVIGKERCIRRLKHAEANLC